MPNYSLTSDDYNAEDDRVEHLQSYKAVFHRHLAVHGIFENKYHNMIYHGGNASSELRLTFRFNF